MPAGRQGKDGRALGQQALGAARGGCLGDTHHTAAAKARKPGRQTPSATAGLTVLEEDTGQRKVFSIILFPSDFFLF